MTGWTGASASSHAVEANPSGTCKHAVKQCMTVSCFLPVSPALRTRKVRIMAQGHGKACDGNARESRATCL